MTRKSSQHTSASLLEAFSKVAERLSRLGDRKLELGSRIGESASSEEAQRWFRKFQQLQYRVAKVSEEYDQALAALFEATDDDEDVNIR